MDSLNAATALGFTFPTPAYLAGAILFGLIGWAAYRYGKKMDRPNMKWVGVALMLYPYAVPQTWLLYMLGTALCAALFWLRE